ncbi:hypothetical protein DM02DRAFT_668503 [Periconia macrospinosa]|uniref:Uncharacterized protein n=1 Tax=Periconia macrospinosa TaxID=97972 RepID=A0A2V1E4A1_9PLEO|nr:hypothetical protein DM02DRAFT_668503 [Periconia macrospinosa]
MSNKSKNVPQYPGLGLPLNCVIEYRQDYYPMGVDSSTYELISVRELAMMAIMDQLTDKMDWHKKVFDEEIVSKWQAEALAVPDGHWQSISTYGKKKYREDDAPEDTELEGIVDETTFKTIIRELQLKAGYFEATGIIPTLDAGFSIAKSDSLVSSKLHESLRDAFRILKDEQAASPDWHPNTNDMVQNLVHPSMYPLVYGRTRGLQEELVGVTDAIEKWAGKGDVINGTGGRHIEGFTSDSYLSPKFWSNHYQWLPANVAFQADGTVKFTSYINNLHPVKHAGIYRTIEELITTSLPMWDQCIAVEGKGAGRTEPRMCVPDEAGDEIPENWIPSDPKECANAEIDWEEQSVEYDSECDDETEKKWEVLRKPRIPLVPYEEISYVPKDEVKLITKFKDSGLQIIVKIASIELTPEKPDFPAGGWHVEGQMNEHIAGTALYYLDSENVTDSHLSFRMQTRQDLSERVYYGQDAYGWLEQVFGTELGHSSTCLQNYGSVKTPQGRLLAFPNVFHHRVSPFSLIDKTKPGHRRFIALWLVDPHMRIISTANVPPQQQDWWLESTFGATPEARSKAVSKMPVELFNLMEQKLSDAEAAKAQAGKLPPELMVMVRRHMDAEKHTLPMSLEEAKGHRLLLMEERGAFVQLTKDQWHSYSYSFCEH